jgi:hypothetical protein
MPEARDESIAELLRDLSQQTATLVRQEVELAKNELAAKGKRAGLGAGLLGAAGLIAVFGLAALIGTAVAGIANVLPVWAALLIVAAALLAAGGSLGAAGKRRLRQGMPPVPTEAVQSTKEDVEWLKTQARSAKP